jgi:pimeloyl-ACP methyl ester carboxylesterase
MSVPLLNFTELGEVGEPLVILHGLFGSSRNWQTLAKQFAQSYRVINLDLRNHGDSFHSEHMSYPDMALDVFNVLEALGVDRANVLGHSMGGKAAMALTHRFPDKVSRLVVADIAPVAYTHGYSAIFDAIAALDIDSIERRKQADEQLAQFIPDNGMRLFLVQNLVIEAGQARWRLNWPVLERVIDDIVSFIAVDDWKIDIPSLFIAGSRSDYVGDQQWSVIRQHFSNPQKVMLDAGHWLHAEKPEPFFKAVSQFLEN